MSKPSLVFYSRAAFQSLGVACIGATLLSQMAQAQSPAADSTLPPVLVTGSLIPTASTLDVAPLDVVTAEKIQTLGNSDILQTLKKITPSLSGSLNVGQEVNNGGFGESNIAIRNQPTLVLLNGRRLGNSSFSSGQFVDLNTIPMAAIDRVEVLKDGASALYGSEAIGGVVNIITKKNYTGTEIGGKFGAATGKGQFYQYEASIVSGLETDRASFVAAAQFFHQDPLKTTDRSTAGMDAAELDALGIYSGGQSFQSPSFDGEVQTGGQRYLLKGHPFLIGTGDYDASLTTPPVFAGQTFTTVDDYNNYAISHGYPNGVYVPYGGLINTTKFGTHTIQSQQRATFFGDGNYQLHGKELQVYGTFLYANIESEGALAPSPVVGLAPKQSNIDIPANNPFNPFGIALGPSGALPPGGPRIRSRFIDSGNRLFQSQTDYYHFVGGLKGEFESGYTWDAGYTYNRYDQVQYTRNAINGSALDKALTPNSDPTKAALGLSQLQNSSGDYVPVWNLFSIRGYNSPETIDAVRTTLFQTGVSDDWSAAGTITGNPFDLPAGKVGLAVGGGFNSASLQVDFDGLTQIGKVPGLNAADPTSGHRDSWAGFVEVRLPITSPEQDLKLLHSLEITASGRYETFDPGGDSAVPKVGLRWQPFDEQVMLRGSYSQSFVAPTTFQLFGGSAVNNPFLLTPDNFAQETTVNLSNSGLKPVDAENYGVGIVISPKCIKGLTVSVDYYHLQTKNDIFRVGEQAMVNDLNVNGSASMWQPYYQRADGTKLTTTAVDQVLDGSWGVLKVPLMNGAQTETDGLDIMANYVLETEKAGTFNFYANANVLFKYRYQDPVSGGPYPYEGLYTDIFGGIAGAQGTLPDYLINCGVTWDTKVGDGKLALTLDAEYVPEVTDLGSLHPSNLDFENNVDDGLNDYTMDGGAWKVNAYYKLDAQISYEIGKYRDSKRWYDNTRVAVGVNNLTDEKPSLIASSTEDTTDKSTYDIVGRFVYFQVSKKF